MISFAGAVATALLFLVAGLIRKSLGASKIAKQSDELKLIEREISYRQENLKELLEYKDRQVDGTPKAAPAKNQLFLEVLNSVHDLVIVWNLKLKPIYISPSVQNILGYSRFDFEAVSYTHLRAHET